MPKLIVAALPIDGQWKKIDPRVIETVQGCDLLIAEERKTAKRLLAVSGCPDKPLELLNEHSSDSNRAEIVKKIKEVCCTALVSDAGTPCIADPDYRLVDQCIKDGVEVLSLPGASSITAALSVSGFPSDRFIFLGFPPKKGETRRRFFTNLENSRITSIFLERPYALKRTLEDMVHIRKDISVSIDIGSENAVNIRGHIASILKQIEGRKAAFVVVVSP
ncbi:MAG: hypothetical protein LBH05_03885 [Deferribacteraceae bacterium]|jgi:16S rRNA (cytidine1402-2'-O)-methyltransferase|nr:hypothetical protein [Deferribacteraceae bacterium]